MEFSGTYSFPYDAQTIWQAITDPATLQRAIPNCTRVEKLSDTEYEAEIKAAVGPLKATFRGRLTLTDLAPPWRYTLHCTGQGGMAGSAAGSAAVTLSPDPQTPGSILKYQAKVKLGGLLGRLAQTLLTGAAARLADGFFAGFSAAIEPPSVLDADIDLPAEQEMIIAPPILPEEAEEIVSQAEPAPASTSGLHPTIWVPGLVVVVGLLMVIFVR